jgi:integrase
MKSGQKLRSENLSKLIAVHGGKIMGVKIKQWKGSWWVFVNHKGNRAAKCAGSYDTAVKAKDFFEEQIACNLYQPPRREERKRVPILRDYFAKFQDSYLKTAVRESTAERYGQCFRLHTLPLLGDLNIDRITKEKIKDLIAALVKKDLARHTIRNVVATLCSVLSHAVDDGLITHNPAVKLGRYFKQARVVHDKIEPLTVDEVPIFLLKAREQDAKKSKGHPEYCGLFLCAIHTGMRAGELAGLQWGDIDWNGKFLMVRRSIRKGRIFETKTGKTRRIDMSDDLIEEIGAFRRRRLEEVLKDGKNEIPEWVFASGEGTPLDMHNIERRTFAKCLQAAGLRKIRFHDLRHTTASLLIQNGAPLAYVKDQLGHSSIKVTVDIYGHLVPGANRQEMNRLPGLNSATPAQPAFAVAVNGGRYRI